MSKRVTLEQLRAVREAMRREGRRLVWTNGCFDLMHVGHAAALARARALGHALAVGLNADASVRALKGPERPFCSQDARAAMLSALSAVDYVLVFGEDGATRCAAELAALAPDVWAKSGDYTPETLDPEERAAVETGGGRIEILPFLDGFGTTRLVSDIRRGDPEKIVSAAFGFLQDADGRLLLAKTRYRDGPRWGLPGGGQSRNESLPETVVREFREETGVAARVARALGTLERIAPSRNRHLVAHLFAMEVDALANGGDAARPRPNPSEHIVAAEWFDDARLASCPEPILGRAHWRRYLADPAAWPPYVLLDDHDE